jgi:glycosyltransferase involved in cell wall biosynthesis
MKKILFLANGRLDSYKAYTQNFIFFARMAKCRDYRVTLSGLTKSDISFLNEFVDRKVIFRKSKCGILKLQLKNIFELISRHYDIVVLGSLYTGMFPLYYFALKINQPKRIIYYMQDPVPETHILMKNSNSFKNKIFYLLAIFCEKIICKISNIIIVPGRGYLEKINERNKLDDKTTLYSYNTWGIQKHLGKDSVIELKPQVIEKFKINKRFPVILYSGKIQRWIRGLEMQLRVLKRLVNIYPKALLIITGTGDTEWMLKLAKDFDLLDNIVLTGEITDEELKVTYTISDIMIFPPVDYLLPTKFFESLLMGLIPIVWKGSKDMVKIMEGATITYDGSEKSLLNTIDQTIKNIDHYKEKIVCLSPKVKQFHKISERSFNIALHMDGDCN